MSKLNWWKRSCAAWVFGAVAAIAAPAQTFRTFHAFKGGPDGSYPQASLLRGDAGTFYGTTLNGGSTSCGDSAGCGTVFKVDSAGAETVLYSFIGGTDGWQPYAALAHDAAGNLYGTTALGGGTFCEGSGCGTVFKITPAGAETLLHVFTGEPDGQLPIGGPLVRDSAGNLYGTTQEGGEGGCLYGCGTVFRLDTNGKETILYSFLGVNGDDGQYPGAGLLLDAAGNLYGTTGYGGDLRCNASTSGCGTVFELDTAGKETVLHRFMGGTDGAYPFAGLISDSAGNLYGTTFEGGSTMCSGGCGTVFKIDRRTGKESILYAFNGAPDGAQPGTGLVRDSGGNLYGTTVAGGTYGWGTVFKLDTAGRESILHTFTGCTDGGRPSSGFLVRAPGGDLFGATLFGGDLTCGNQLGCGVVFGVNP